MPRLNPAEIPPVTAADVDALWRQGTRRGPYPDLALCTELAKHFNAHRAYVDPLRARFERDTRVADAVRIVLNACNTYLRPFERAERTDLPDASARLVPDEYDIAYENRPGLLELRAIFSPVDSLTCEEAALLATAPNGETRISRLRRSSERLPPVPGRTVRQPPIWEPCGIICWMVVRDACYAVNRHAGTHHTSAAVQIATLVCRRLGFKMVTVGALSRRLKAYGDSIAATSK